jgi:hypothetical protein
MAESKRRPNPPMRGYNLFRREPQNLVCAVPEDRAVPGFITAERWSFQGSLRDEASAPPGFDRQAARVGVRLNGFHLFQVTE